MPKAKRTANRERTGSTTETSRPSLKVEFGEGFLKQLRARSGPQRKVLGEAVNAAIAAWGKPHLHVGTGIRRLHGAFFECRSGLQTRLIFEWTEGGLLFHFEGSHDEVRRFVKGVR